MAVTSNANGIIFADSSYQTTAAVTNYTGAGIQVFKANGTFTVPTGVTKLKVTAFGGGGGGFANGGDAGSYPGGSGGAGIAYVTTTPGTSYTVTVGAGGNGGGGSGGTTTFGSVVTATGGLGSIWNTQLNVPGIFTTTATALANTSGRSSVNFYYGGGSPGTTSYSYVSAGGGGLAGGGGAASSAGGSSLYGDFGETGGSNGPGGKGGNGGGPRGGIGSTYANDGYNPISYPSGGGGTGGVIVEW